jgi:pyridoxine/pyridoxamine 5'-phosphate oxidase
MKFPAIAAATFLFFDALACQQAAIAGPIQIEEASRITCQVNRPAGSRLGGTRLCRTQIEWAQDRTEMRNVVHRLQTEGHTNCVPTPERPNIC